MKKIIMITLILLCSVVNCWAVMVTGSGSTKEEAINNGLREAIEMYTGTLIYGVTDVENYQLQKDQIVASSLGHIKSYKIVKILKIDDNLIITLDVNLSEDKIEKIVRDNVNLITYEEVIQDYNNITERQDQIKKLTEMLTILHNRPVHEKYSVNYEGYEIKKISATKVDVILNTRIILNPFYSKAYNEILKNLSQPAGSSETWIFGGKYRLEYGKLINAKYYISKDANPPTDSIKACITINGNQIDKCYEYRDNLIVIYDPLVVAKGIVNLFPKIFNKSLNGEETTIDKKWQNVAIQKSKIIPQEGFLMKIKYQITDKDEIKNLKNLKLTLDKCVNK